MMLENKNVIKLYNLPERFFTVNYARFQIRDLEFHLIKTEFAQLVISQNLRKH